MFARLVRTYVLSIQAIILVRRIGARGLSFLRSAAEKSESVSDTPPCRTMIVREVVRVTHSRENRE
jgi:hypothetical protein